MDAQIEELLLLIHALSHKEKLGLVRYARILRALP